MEYFIIFTANITIIFLLYKLKAKSKHYWNEISILKENYDEVTQNADKVIYEKQIKIKELEAKIKTLEDENNDYKKTIKEQDVRLENQDIMIKEQGELINETVKRNRIVINSKDKKLVNARKKKNED